MTEDRKPRRKLTPADHIAEWDAKIARDREQLEHDIEGRAEYIAEQHARAAALTAELPKE